MPGSIVTLLGRLLGGVALTLFLIHVMGNRAARDGAQNGVMMRKMSGEPADHRALQASRFGRRSRCQKKSGRTYADQKLLHRRKLQDRLLTWGRLVVGQGHAVHAERSIYVHLPTHPLDAAQPALAVALLDPSSSEEVPVPYRQPMPEHRYSLALLPDFGFLHFLNHNPYADSVDLGIVLIPQ